MINDRRIFHGATGWRWRDAEESWSRCWWRARHAQSAKKKKIIQLVPLDLHLYCLRWSTWMKVTEWMTGCIQAQSHCPRQVSESSWSSTNPLGTKSSTLHSICCLSPSTPLPPPLSLFLLPAGVVELSEVCCCNETLTALDMWPFPCTQSWLVQDCAGSSGALEVPSSSSNQVIQHTWHFPAKEFHYAVRPEGQNILFCCSEI